MEVITQDDGYYEKKLLSWLICHVLLLLSSINLNVYVINKCEFDLLIYIFLKYYYISNCRVGGGGEGGEVRERHPCQDRPKEIFDPIHYQTRPNPIEILNVADELENLRSTVHPRRLHEGCLVEDEEEAAIVEK